MGAHTDDEDACARQATLDLAEDEAARLRQRLSRAVARVCPASLATRSDDIVQVAMMRVMEVLRRGERGTQLASSYLWKVAHSATIDELRRLRRQREVPLGDDPQPNGPADAVDPERSQASHEIAVGLQACLQGLVEARRLAVTLHLLGHSVPEAARLLGWDSKRTENLVYRGLADLRQCLISKGLQP